MKIVIDLEEIDMGLSPNLVYRTLFMEYWSKLQKIYHDDLWGLANACDSIARQLFAHKTKRKTNVKNLILSYRDAELCFELFKQFADIWACNYLTENKVL